MQFNSRQTTISRGIAYVLYLLMVAIEPGPQE